MFTGVFYCIKTLESTRPMLTVINAQETKSMPNLNILDIKKEKKNAFHYLSFDKSYNFVVK